MDLLKKLEREMEYLRKTLEEIDAAIVSAIERLARIDLLKELAEE